LRRSTLGTRAQARRRARFARSTATLGHDHVRDLLVNLIMFNFGHVVALDVGAKFGPVGGTAVDVAVVFLAVTVSEVVPKAVSVHAPAKVATLTALPLVVVERLLRWPRAPISHVAGLLPTSSFRRREEGDVTPKISGRALGAAARRRRIRRRRTRVVARAARSRSSAGP
jgi:CBS domain containing-hemolysin-like protein